MQHANEIHDSTNPVQAFELTLPLNPPTIETTLVLDETPVLPADFRIPPKSTIREVLEFVTVTIIVALFGTTFLVQGMKVPTGSMQNTIQIGDHLLVDKFVHGRSAFLPFVPGRQIKRGDIIVFKYPGNRYDPELDEKRGVEPYSINYVKRVVGEPGDVIEISGKVVKVNSVPLDEAVLIADEPCANVQDGDPCHNGPLNVLGPTGKDKPGVYRVYYEPGPDEASDSYPVFQNDGHDRKITVPADSYFVMGDNRDNSEDSRYWGFVDRDLIVGRALFVYWSYDESSTPTGNPLTNFISNSRWRRVGTMLR